MSIETEPVWATEVEPPAIRALGNAVALALQLPADAIGIKGNAVHFYGYHRSRHWILTSAYSSDGADDYSIQTARDKGGDPNWLCALDITPGDGELMITLSERLDAALRAGKLPKVREFFGNVDGNKVVDGYAPKS